MADSTLQLRSVLGEADVLILRKTESPVVCAGEERPARCPREGVANKLSELLVNAM